MRRCRYLLILLFIVLNSATAQEATPKSAVGYNARGLTRYDKGDLDGAIADFNKSLDLDPAFWPTYVARGLVLAAKGDYEAAIAAYNKAIEINPAAAQAYKDRGKARYGQGDSDGAINDLNRSLELEPGNTDASLARGRAHLSMADYDGALNDYNRVISTEPTEEAYTGRGLARKGKRDFDGAIADFAQAIAYKTNNPEPYLGRGLAYLEQGDLDRSLADFDKALTLEPKSADAQNGRGMVLSNRNDFVGAISEFTKALAINPKLAAAFYNRAWNRLYLSQGELAHADTVEYLRHTSNERDESSRLYMVIVGYFGLRQAQKHDEAKAFVKAYALDPNASNWPALVMKYLRREMTAQELLTLGSGKGPKSEVRARLYIGMDSALSGDRESAFGHLRWAKVNAEKTSREYFLAANELTRLEAQRTPVSKPSSKP